jgi:hypothetical protein
MNTKKVTGHIFSITILSILVILAIGSSDTQSGTSHRTDINSAAYKAGFKDGYMVGKNDAAEGRARDGQKAMRLGEIHSKSYDSTSDRKNYATGYHWGYNEGWHARNSLNR